jgi:type IV pilus assembly protein PilF
MATRAVTWAAVLALSAAAMATACGGAQASSDDRARSEYHYKLARGYYNDRNLAMTQRELHESLKLDPQNFEALHLRGFLRMGLNDQAGAVADFKAALEAKPDFSECRNNLGSALIAQGRYAEAVEALRPVLEDALYPTPAFAQGNTGWAYYMQKEYEQARRHLETAVFLNPRFCLGFNNLGLVHRDTGNLRSATEAFEKAVKLCPTYAEPWYHLGVLRQEGGDAAGADDAFAKCAEAAPDTAMGRRCSTRR